jgi:hypothetical protein
MTPETSTDEAPTPVTGAVTSSLPPGLCPLLNQRQLEEFYGVSNWLVNEWIKAGMPTVPMHTAGRKRQRRFDLDAVKAWHADRVQLAASA